MLDPHFDPDSYGYRPSRSAKDAVRVTRQRCWKYDWVLEFDVKGAFDNLDHDLLWKALRKHTDCKWVLLYVGRWLKAPSISETGETRPRDRGTPQGSVVGPVLMNLFMHYAFDRWMRRNVASCPFARYADDAVVHCASEQEAVEVKRLLTERFAACGLELHPEKTRIVYCKEAVDDVQSIRMCSSPSWASRSGRAGHSVAVGAVYRLSARREPRGVDAHASADPPVGTSTPDPWHPSRVLTNVRTHAGRMVELLR